MEITMKNNNSANFSYFLKSISLPIMKAQQSQIAAKPINQMNPNIRHSEADSSASIAVCDSSLTVQGLKMLELKSPKRKKPQNETGIDNETKKIIKF